MNAPKRFAALIAGLAIAVSACSSAATTAPSAAPSESAAAPSESAAAPSESAAAPSAAAGLSGNITVWNAYSSSGGDAENKAFNRILQNVQAANPNLNVTVLVVPFSDIFKKFETESAAGGGPDLFIAPNDSLGSESRMNVLAVLDGKIDDTLNNSTDQAVAGSKVDGKLYEIPESLKAVEMYYDTAKVKTAPTSTTELLAAVKGGLKVGLIASEYFGWGWYAAFGGKIMDDTGKCVADQTSGVADSMQFVADLKKAGALLDWDYNKVNDAFKGGKIDMIFNGNWVLGDYRTARPGLAVAAMPAGPGGNAAPLVAPDGYYINAAGQNQDLAIAFAQQMVNQAAQEIYTDVAGHVPANKNVKIIDPLVKSFSDAFATAMARPQSKQMDNYWANFNNAWHQVLDKGTDPKAAVAAACAGMNKANGL